MGKEKVNQLLALTIGELREKLAYADAEDTVEDWLDWTELDNDAYEDEDECDYCEEDYEDDSWDDEDDFEEEDDYEEEEEDDEDISLPYDEEILAQDIAGDIVAGKYALEAIQGLYAPIFVDRVRQIADLEEE
jgi:hypothetical protein